MFRSWVLTFVLVSTLVTGAYASMDVSLDAFDAAQNHNTVIPDSLRPYLQDYVDLNSTLRAGFIPYRAQIVWREPLEVTFRVENLGPKDFTFGFGGDYRGTGRHDRIKIMVTDASGKPLSDPHADALDFGGIVSSEVLTPGGPIFQRKIDLTQYRTFEKPGEYSITCSFAFDDPFSTSKNEPARPVVQTHFHLTILERTPERVSATLKEMVARATAAPQQDLPAALELIAHFGGDEAAPILIQLTHRGAVERRAAAVAALPLLSAASTLDAAVAALQDPDPTIRVAAAGALGTIVSPRAVEALLQALRREKSPVANAVLIALGASKSNRTLPVIVDSLDHGSTELRQAAVTALVAYGGDAAIAALEKSVGTDDLALRYQVVLALAEKLQQPLKTEWLFPILMGRTQSNEWLDSLRLVRMYAGDPAIPTLCSCLDFDAAWSGRNWWIISQVQACREAPSADYIHDWNREGTPAELEQNRRVLANLKRLAGPIPPVAPRSVRSAPPYLKTDPPIDFVPILKLTQDSAQITSGFLHITLRRNSLQVLYTPSEAYRSMYETANHIRKLVQHPEQYAALGITEQQARQFRALSLPPDEPDLTGSMMLYMVYKESPVGPLQKEAGDDLNDAVRVSSQSYHAAVAAFVEAAGKILSPSQLDRL